MPPQTGVRSGLLLVVIGVWVLMRTVNPDVNKRTLINHILGTNADGTPYTGPALAGAMSGAATSVAATVAAANRAPALVARSSTSAMIVTAATNAATAASQAASAGASAGVPLVRVNGSSPNVTVR